MDISTVSSSAALPLSGVQVLDFTRVLAGPFCTMLLADMGADVIKVESLDGDDTRAWGPPWFTDANGAHHAAYYLSVNRNKQSIALNLKSESGRAIAHALAEKSHIVVENFKPGGMAAFGLGYPELSTLQPALVYASITGYGQTGIYSERPGYDFVIQGQSGLMSITGAIDDEPYKVGVAIADVFAGLFAVTSILAALRHAERTGQGQHLDIALLDSQIAALVNVASNALVSGANPARYGNAHSSIVPYQAFRAADGDFTLAVGNDRQFAALCRLIQHPEWRSDARFTSNPARVQNRVVLIKLLSDIFATRPADDWVREALALGIPAGEINSVMEALDDPHTRARGLIHAVEMGGAMLSLVGMPVQFGNIPSMIRMPPPTLGEHTDAILGGRLGMDADAIARLRSEGVISNK